MSLYDTPRGRSLRHWVLRRYAGRCMLCGRTAGEAGTSLEVDHIKPVSKYPHLEFDTDNLQVLCKDCNQGKSNRYEDDWRPMPTPREFIDQFLGRDISKSRKDTPLPRKVTRPARQWESETRQAALLAEDDSPLPQKTTSPAEHRPQRKRRRWLSLWLIFKLGFITFTGVLVWLSFQLP